MITIRNLPKGVLERLVEDAKRRGISLNVMIKIIIYNYCDKEKEVLEYAGSDNKNS